MGAAEEPAVSVRELEESKAVEGEIPPRASRRVPRQVSAGELAENKAAGWRLGFCGAAHRE